MSNDKQEATGKQFYETADKIITVEKQERSYSEEDTREKPLNQNKITAVEWLSEQLWLTPQYETEWQKIIEQAKEMEKQQIIEAHIKGDNTYTVGGAYHSAAEQYYNEEYGK